MYQLFLFAITSVLSTALSLALVIFSDIGGILGITISGINGVAALITAFVALSAQRKNKKP